MSAHSPGPWEMHPAPYGWDVWANTPEKFRQWITPVTRLASPHKAIFDGSIEVDDETCEANARLIAAAPDLLEALRMVRHGMTQWGISTSAPEWNAVLSAITKAEASS